jgi:hypothetical protein
MGWGAARHFGGSVSRSELPMDQFVVQKFRIHESINRLRSSDKRDR